MTRISIIGGIRRRDSEGGGGEGTKDQEAHRGGTGEAGEFMRVACRVRPAEEDDPRVWVVSGKSVAAIPPPPERGGPHLTGRYNANNLPCFSFDQAFGEDSTNTEVYQQFCKQAVHHAIEGCKSTLMLYGQTGAGKTHTISGTKSEPGVFSYAMKDIFAAGANCEHGKFLCQMSVLAVYNERVLDMLNPSGPEPLEMMGRELLRDKNRQPVTKFEVSSQGMAENVFNHAEKHRRYAETRKNSHSSRSHTIFIINVSKTSTECLSPTKVGGTSGNVKERGREQVQVTTKGTLYLVDLAGSESTKESGATGLKKRETEIINKSLLALTEVLSHLSRGGSPDHAPYRRSMLTRVLRPCLGGVGDEGGENLQGKNCRHFGNSFAAMVFCIDPLNLHVSEKTLKYGLVTKAIRVQYGIHMVREKSNEASSSQLSLLQKEIEELRAENARLEKQRVALLLIWRRGWKPWIPNMFGQKNEGKGSPSPGNAALPPRHPSGTRRALVSPLSLGNFKRETGTKERKEAGRQTVPQIARIRCHVAQAPLLLEDSKSEYGDTAISEDPDDATSQGMIDFQFDESDWESEEGCSNGEDRGEKEVVVKARGNMKRSKSCFSCFAGDETVA